MAQFVGWDAPGNQWSTLRLAGELLPGEWYVRAVAGGRLDVKKSKGRDAARIVDEGYDPVAVAIEGRLVSGEYEAWAKLLPKIYARTPGGKRSPISITHPSTQLMGVQHVIIEEIGSPELDDEGFGRIFINGLQWVREPKKKPNIAPQDGGNKNSLDYPDWNQSKVSDGLFFDTENMTRADKSIDPLLTFR